MDGIGGSWVQKRVDRGKWQGIVKYFDYDSSKPHEPGTPMPKIWHRATKNFGIPCEAGSNRGKATAERMLAEWVAALESKSDERTEVRHGTVGEWVAAQIDSKEASDAIAPHTVDDYRRCLAYINGSSYRGKMIDGIGNIRLEKLQREQVQAWVNQMALNYSVQTVRKALMVLKDVGLKMAVLDHKIPFNPAEGVQVAATPKPKEPNYLDAAQRARLLDFLAGVVADPKRASKAVAVECGLLAGLREAEICAVRWRDLDLCKGMLKVTGTINHTQRKFIDSRTLKTKSTKTAGSARSIPLAGRLLADLRHLQALTKAECLRTGIPFTGKLYVFGYIDGRFLLPPMLWRWWNKWARRLGLVGSQGEMPTFHDLRHTFATTAISEGVDVKSVSSILGHANAAMTLNIYASSDPEAKRRAMERVSEAMQSAPSPAELYQLAGTGTEG